ncbi:MAG: glutaredoxin family protein [Gammaproteobacteria bacterium]
MLELTLLGTADCSLCETFALALQQWVDAQRRPVHIDVIDICDAPELETRYGWHIPVLLSGEQLVCSGHFDADSLSRQP